jgi:glucosylceramidase
MNKQLNMKTLFNICILSFLQIFQVAFAQNVKWISTTEQDRWVTNEPLQMKPVNSALAIDIEILPNQKQQTIEGWGGCFNELGWDALQLLGVKERESVLKSLFDPNEGLKFNICRMPVGANDYARKWYSLNDSAGDFQMKYFSIAHDKTVLVPFIREAMKYQPKLKLWASPWSPPVWMKTNKHYANKPGDYNDLKPENAVLSGDQFIQESKYLLAYAYYLTKFVKAYQSEGINIFAVHFQNEPYTLNQWPNCLWTPEAMRDFIANYLGPCFTKEKLTTELWLGTWNTDKMANFDIVLSSAEAMKYIAGAGLQWEGKNVINELHKKYPSVKLMQTESECGQGDFSWKDGEHLFDLMKIYLDGGVTAYMYWNMVLTDKGTSTWGWNQNALIHIDRASLTVTFTPEYFAFKHFSYFVTPGSVKIENTGSFKNIVAFVTPKKEVVIVANNLHDNPKTINVKIGLRAFSATLPAKSFNTFVTTD